MTGITQTPYASLWGAPFLYRMRLSWQPGIRSHRHSLHFHPHTMHAQPNSLPDKRAAATHLGLKFFGYFVLLLMVVAIIYTCYIVVANWSHIGV